MFFLRRTWWFILLAVIAIVLIGQQVFIAIPSRAQNAQTTTFDNPSIGGQRLDWCNTWRTNCGAAAAKAFCQAKGYSEAVKFAVDPSPKITKVIGDGKTCIEGVNNPGCDSFKFITCSNKSTGDSKDNILLPEEHKDALNKMSNERKLAGALGVFSSLVCFAAVPPGVNFPCLTLLRFSTIALATSDGFKLLALDPPDPNYTIIYQPLFPSLPDLPVRPGLTQAEVNAFNALFKNQLQAIGFANAAYISYNRASGAINANNAAWEQKQLRTAKQYTQKLASLLDAEPELLIKLVNVLQRNGFPTITVSLDVVRNFQSSFRTNGLPNDLIKILQQLGADRNTIERIRQSIIKQNPKTIQGKYPQDMRKQSLLDALQETAQKLKNPTSLATTS